MRSDLDLFKTNVIKPPAIFFLIFILAFIVTLQIFIFGVPKAHDSMFHIFWTEAFYSQLCAGDFSPRFLVEGDHGFGSPEFIYGGPLLYYLSSLVKWITVESLSTKYLIGTVITLMNFFGGAGVFLAIRPYVKQIQALVAAIAYILIPYHLLIDTYYRFSYSELMAMAVIPYAFIQPKKKIEYYLVLMLSCFFILISHAPASIISLPCIALFHFINRSDWFKAQILSYLSAFLLSSFYVIPALFIDNPNMHILYELFNYADNFLYQDILNKFRVWPFRFVVVLYLSSLLNVFVLGCIVIYWINKKQVTKIELSIFIMGMLGVIMTTKMARPFYEIFTLYQNIQFPWRWNVISSLSASLLIAFLWGKQRVWNVLIMSILFCSLISPIVSQKFSAIKYWSPEEVSNIVKRRVSPPGLKSEHDRSKNQFKNNSKLISSRPIKYEVLEWGERKIKINGDFLAGDIINLRRNYWGEWDAENNTDAYKVMESPEGFVQIRVNKQIGEISAISRLSKVYIFGYGLSVLGIIFPFLILQFFRKSI